MKKNIAKNYKDILSIPDDLKKNLPTSYDTVGNIALLKINKSLLVYRRKIGESLLEANKNIRTVCVVKPVSGEYRTREVEIIAGEKKTETLHKEYGLMFFLDVKKTYFSPRLANERKRISNLVKPDETIVDMFTGVAPFPIMIAKYSEPKIIFAVDKNRHAIYYAQKNITINNVLDKVEPIHEDAVNLPKTLKKYKVKADRIIMNLPFSNIDFFNKALNIAANKCVIHYYDIQAEENINAIIDKLTKIAKREKVEIIFYKVNKIKSYSAHEFYIGVDITTKKI